MAGAHLKADTWIYEYITPWDYYAHGVREIICHRRTAYQDMVILETGAYGRALVLDGKWQSSAVDEFLYHEPLVHPAMLMHGAPQNVLILGGGEGAAAREILAWDTVRRVVMVDIDEEVVRACREHLRVMHEGVFDDPRLEVVIDDAGAYIERTDDRWDVILSDLADPIENGPSFQLFTKEFFAKLRERLVPGGSLVVQAGPVSPPEMHLHCRLANTLRQVFFWTASLSSFVPTYAAPWSFIVARHRPPDALLDRASVDVALAKNVRRSLRMLDGAAFEGIFLLPLHLRRAIEAERTVYTLADPPVFFGEGKGVGFPTAGAK